MRRAITWIRRIAGVAILAATLRLALLEIHRWWIRVAGEPVVDPEFGLRITPLLGAELPLAIAAERSLLGRWHEAIQAHPDDELAAVEHLYASDRESATLAAGQSGDELGGSESGRTAER